MGKDEDPRHPAAKALAAVLPTLTHPKGAELRLVNLIGDGDAAKRVRMDLAEAVVHTLETLGFPVPENPKKGKKS